MLLCKQSLFVIAGFFMFMMPSALAKLLQNDGGGSLARVECGMCEFAMGMMQTYIKSNPSEHQVGNFLHRIFLLSNLVSSSMSEGLAKLFKEEVTIVLRNVSMNPTEICGFLFADCIEGIHPSHNWTVPLPSVTKPPVIEPQQPSPESPVLKVLHLSDLHFDPLYEEGSNANCKETLCCRADSSAPETPEDAAGYWGDYRNCDTPLRTLKNVLEHINKTHQLDYVIMTGDIHPHNIWSTSRAEVVHILHHVTNLLDEYLGRIPIFPALGNHASVPANSFPIPSITGKESVLWLYEEVERAWLKWLPNNYTIKYGAYYSALVKPGFRIISLNMNYCNNLNLWLLINATDPAEELAWLITQLQMAEDKGEKVHIIGHIPPGHYDCLVGWSRNYYRIINRYENTVAAQFFGHTHKDEFALFYDKSGLSPRPTSIAYIGPSISPFEADNPGYRIYTIDGDYKKSSYVVLDHETYITNLTESNLSKQLIWEFEYNAKSAYNMTSLTPKDLDVLVDRLYKDESLFDLFYLYYHKMSDFDSPPCGETCKKELLCKLRQGQPNDAMFCA